MSESLFRVGGVYRDGCGVVLRLVEATVSRQGQLAAYAKSLDQHGEFTVNYGVNILADGTDGSSEGDRFHLIPGELTNINGEWVSMTPTLDKLEAEKEEGEVMLNGLTVAETDATASVTGVTPKTEPGLLKELRDLLAIQGMDGTWNSDSYMCGLYNGLELALATAEGRDPQYRTLKPTQAPAPVSTAHKAIPGLSRMSEGDHRFGRFSGR